jgi:hypothetical protein
MDRLANGAPVTTVLTDHSRSFQTMRNFEVKIMLKAVKDVKFITLYMFITMRFHISNKCFVSNQSL